MGIFSDIGDAVSGGVTSGISGGIESAIGAGVGSLLGGAQGSVGIERTVRKAKRAGIHPLFALGYGGGYPEGGAQIMKGQDTTGSDTRKALAAAEMDRVKAQSDMYSAEAELARSKAARLMQQPKADTVEDMEGRRSPYGVRGQIVPAPRRNPRRTLGNSAYYPDVPPRGYDVWLGGKKYTVLRGTSQAETLEQILGDLFSEAALAPYNLQDTVLAPSAAAPSPRKPLPQTYDPIWDEVMP